MKTFKRQHSTEEGTRMNKHRFTQLILAVTMMIGIHEVAAQGTTLTYNARLLHNGYPANGIYDVHFMVFDHWDGGNQVGGTLKVGSVPVRDGLLTYTLEFGDEFFTWPARWLEVAVRPSGHIGPYAVLGARLQLTRIPNPV